jgi:hypothetical protein
VKLLLALFLLFSVNGFASFEDCENGLGKYGNLGEMRYQVGKYNRSGVCFISLGPSNRYPLYRSYTFDSEGELMIFNSLGAGRPSTDTGARNYLFPIKTQKLSFELDEKNEYIRIKNTDGRTWVFDARSSKIESVTDMEVLEDPDVNRSNQGGVELSILTKGTLIDEGFRLGGLPNTVLKRSSAIKDSYGNECLIKNNKLFKLDIDDSGSIDGAYFIHNSEAKWKKFLKRYCKEIEL